ncbi:MAG TPA: hypothetical protein VIM56_15000 [Rhizomicrobium sp.]
MNPDYFRKRADDYRNVAQHCADDRASGDLYSLSVLFRSMANDLERQRTQRARPHRQRPLVHFLQRAA